MQRRISSRRPRGATRPDIKSRLLVETLEQRALPGETILGPLALNVLGSAASLIDVPTASSQYALPRRRPLPNSTTHQRLHRCPHRPFKPTLGCMHPRPLLRRRSPM